ncbi:MAG: hypothetical protein AB7I27_01145 [Bacteriovoracaceae bacterium]
MSWLIAHYGQEQMRPGLSRMRRGLSSLLPEFKNTKIITIAGTNGKGETTLRLSQLLKHHSHFAWTSPHIERINERFRNEEGEIQDQELLELIELCHQRVLDEKFELSFYEFLFLVFCTWAAKKPPEFLLLEVGLGGRLDAVNVFDADLILLPSISRDHQEVLGRRYEQILAEKLGLLRAKSTLISFLDLKYLREKARVIVESNQCSMIDLQAMMDIPAYEFSQRNQLLACAAYLKLQGKELTPKELLESKTQSESLLHRGEVWRDGGEWIFFGSHNVDGMRKLIQFLHSHNYNFSRPPFDAVIMAFSKRDQADLRVMLKMMKGAKLGKVIVTTFPHPKAADKDLMESLSFQEGLEFANDIRSYCERNSRQNILFTGSYYFIGHIQSSFRRSE